MADALAPMLGNHGVCLAETRIQVGDSFVKPDCHTRVPCVQHSLPEAPVVAYTLVGEWKLEIGDGGCDPLAQAGCVHTALCSADKVSSYLLLWPQSIYGSSLSLIVWVYSRRILLPRVSHRLHRTILRHPRSCFRRSIHGPAPYRLDLPRPQRRKCQYRSCHHPYCQYLPRPGHCVGLP